MYQSIARLISEIESRTTSAFRCSASDGSSLQASSQHHSIGSEVAKNESSGIYGKWEPCVVYDSLDPLKKLYAAVLTRILQALTPQEGSCRDAPGMSRTGSDVSFRSKKICKGVMKAEIEESPKNAPSRFLS